MSTDTGRKYRDGLQALLAPDMDATSTALVDALTQVRYSVVRGLYASANVDTTAAANIWNATLDPSTSVRMKIDSCHITVDNTVTAANTDVIIFSLVYNNANGGSDTTIATINTATTAGSGSGDLTAGVPYSIALTAANSVVPAGSALVWKMTKGGSGKGSGTYSVNVKAKPI